MITNILGFLMILGCIGIGFIVLIYGLQFLAVIVMLIATCVVAFVQWLKKQFRP